MKASTMTLEQVRAAGLKALARELGPVGLIRFLQQFETGSGDYSTERHRWLGDHTVEELAQEIKQRSGANIMYQQLGYLMRSGSPDSLDRMVAVSYGNLALDQVSIGHTGRMVALQQGNYTAVPLKMVISAKKTVDVQALYDIENYKPRVRDMLGKPMFLY